MALARLQHPHIVNVFDSGRHEGRLFFAMELLVGQDLADHLQKHGSLDERKAWSIARQTATALAHAASAGIIHRDIKPANLYLVPPPTGYPLPPGVPMVKVTDFGLALTTETDRPSDSTNRLTHTGTVVGTPIYMAPEQFTKPDIDSRADIYSLGATVHHMLQGVPPFDGKTIWEVMAKKNDPQPPPLGERISQGSVDLVAAMMQPDPNRRIGSYAELLYRIDELLFELDPLRTSVLPMRRPAIPRRQFALAAALALTVLLAAAGVVGYVSRDRTPGLVVQPTVSSAPTKFVSEGKSLALFNSENISNWSIGGRWSVDEDIAEGGNKIIGLGTLRTQFDRKPPFRIAIGLDLYEPNTTAELLVGKTRGPVDQSITYTLKMGWGGVRLGKRSGERVTWEAIGPTLPYPTPDQLGEGTPFLPVEIEALGERWLVRFNGSTVGEIPDGASLGLGEVSFTVVGGKIRIESVILEYLRPAE